MLRHKQTDAQPLVRYRQLPAHLELLGNVSKALTEDLLQRSVVPPSRGALKLHAHKEAAPFRILMLSRMQYVRVELGHEKIHNSRNQPLTVRAFQQKNSFRHRFPFTSVRPQ